MLINNLLYILQINNYEKKKFLFFSYTHPNWFSLQKRGKLIFTKKASLIYLLSMILSVCLVLFFSFFYNLRAGVISIFIVCLFLPFIILLSLLIIKPIDAYLKNRLIKAAALILKSVKNLIVIGITGSYGKTSAKEILNFILSEKFKVLITPENINTDLGIADFIVKKKNELNNYEIFIVEMGAYKIGEIKKICDLVRPKYSILTGINEAHLERFGSLANTVKAKFELAEATESAAILNFSDNNIKDNYKRFKINDPVGAAIVQIENINILENFSGLEFTVDNEKFKTQLLAEHNINLILLARALAQKLGLSADEIKRGVNKIKIIKHRLEPIYNKNTNIWIIDDSYNGNLKGIISGLAVLRRAQGRKLVLTPGLVELGEKSEEIHKKIGELYAKTVDFILLINSKNTKWIKEALDKNNYKNYKVYHNTVAAHADLKNILRAGDTIIFQNDLPDNYF
jgi:UDP-N-acetylmuramoyl-tripeptide--D-alanyl-D-alanine ligase